MTKDEQYQLCKEITVAARRMGFGMRDDSNEALRQYQFSWVDLMGGAVIKGEPADVRENAFELACHALVDHIKVDTATPSHENAPEQSPLPNQAAPGHEGNASPAQGHQPAPVRGSDGGVGGAQV